MQTLFKQQSHTLSGGSVLSGVTEQHVILKVVSGRVWVTFEGQPEDHWLHAGRSLTLLPGRMVVVEADPGNSRISLSGLPQRGTPSILRALLARLRGPGFHPATSVS
ncbi:Protein of unknown function (DUF2917) [Collimonas sp. PA-H2]|uniref:DUF2917 domain-containing protein n=1 Tax=Collimonas sp. PA-H2 TaxID=1881062 RepID=UPI000BF8B57F|nr:DUF2917 domain-containing protein [Collimonas sp. PA-H2]PFH11925.1 Protein of unknown function (DUF2917) [Collimonas sp. PA-H2]